MRRCKTTFKQRERQLTAKNKDWFLERAQVREHPFASEAPLIGPLIARFREAWNSVAAKWYVRPLLHQQNLFNRMVAERLYDQELRLVEQDREQVALTHDLTELTVQLAQANRLLSSIDRRLARLEEHLEEAGRE